MIAASTPPSSISAIASCGVKCVTCQCDRLLGKPLPQVWIWASTICIAHLRMTPAADRPARDAFAATLAAMIGPVPRGLGVSGDAIARPVVTQVNTGTIHYADARRSLISQRPAADPDPVANRVHRVGVDRHVARCGALPGP